VYTLDADFDDGELVNVNHDTPNNDQLQLDTPAIVPFVYVAASGRGTIVRIDAENGDILGEYLTAPEGLGLNPSRTAVDGFGNVWTANRDENGLIGGVAHGSVVKVGLVIGGTRVNADGTLNPSGDYLSPPFRHNTCVDRDDDGFIKTSRGLGDVRPWPNLTDGEGGTDGSGDGIVEDAEDECILLYQRLANAENAHQVSVDANDDVWVGGYPSMPRMFYKLDGKSAAVLDSFDAGVEGGFGCGGFGGFVDGSGILWSADFFEGSLLRYDPAGGTGECISINNSYGLAIDTDGFIYNSTWSSELIVKVDPSDFSIVNEFSTELDSRADQGLAITPDNNNIWVAKGFGFEVSRLDDLGNVVKVIQLGETQGSNPTGVAVDANGKVWVTNLGSSTVMRIDPNGDDDEKGMVDLTVDLTADFQPSADPDNYGNMTGAVAPLGTWTVIDDSGLDSNSWGTIIWNTEEAGSEPPGTLITVEARAADTIEAFKIKEGNEGYVEYEEVDNGVEFFLIGRFIQIRATLKPDSKGTSPVLSDLEVISLLADRMLCDVDENGIVDFRDIIGIFYSLGDTADGPDDPRDWNRDEMITKIDAKGCIRECTNKYCAPSEIEDPCLEKDRYSKKHRKSKIRWYPTKRWRG
jgi:streptogramin lyase